MSTFSKLVAAVAASLALVAPATDATAALDPGVVSCRATVAKAGGKYVKTVQKVLAGCHKNQAKGKDSGLDCNDLSSADTPKGKAAKAAGKVAPGLAKKCGGVVPADAFYGTCPAPCDAVVASIANFDDVAACLVCLVDTATETLSTDLQGAPTQPLDKSDAKCNDGIGKAYGKLLGTIVKEVTKCQANAEKKDGAETITDCTDTQFPQDKVVTAQGKAVGGVSNACLAANFGNLDTCAAGQVDTANCVRDDTTSAGIALTTQMLAFLGGGVTTTTTSTTTTSTVTTTTLAQDPLCPSRAELIIHAGLGNECTTNADCTSPPETCELSPDWATRRCTSGTNLATGWSGLGHGADVNDDVRSGARLACAGPADPDCGECTVLGIDASLGSCRCGGRFGNTTICDQPFEADADDCSWGTCIDLGTCSGGFCTNDPTRPCTINGQCGNRCSDLRDRSCFDDSNCGPDICQCVFGPPLPLSASSTPACVINKFANDISGTANPDLGAGQIVANLLAEVHLGLLTFQPCPLCVGDITPGDGNRDGTCDAGLNAGGACDGDGLSRSFPAQSAAASPGGYHSLDCYPDNDVSNGGLTIGFTQTTGVATLNANVDCDPGSPGDKCPCKVCNGDDTLPCNTDAECAAALGGSCSVHSAIGCSANVDCDTANVGPCISVGGGNFRCQKTLTTGAVDCTADPAICDSVDAGDCELATCSAFGIGVQPEPNQCDGVCVDQGGGQGECDAAGPDNTFCDLVVSTSGNGLLGCLNNNDCLESNVGIDGGTCSLSQRRKCFLDPIVGTGVQDPNHPIGAAAFCIPPVDNTGINVVTGLPGPGRVLNQGSPTYFCPNGSSYTPGGSPACTTR